MNSFYFNTVTMVTVGYGDISPNTNIEKFIWTIIVIFACGVFAYSINEVYIYFVLFNYFFFFFFWIQNKIMELGRMYILRNEKLI